MSVDITTFSSDVLRGNVLGDPHERRVPVYLPPAYERGSARYPAVYLLAGFSGRGTSFLNEAAWEETFPQRLDRLIGSGTIRPLIVVMPDCMTGGSQYLNSSATGRYQDHLVDELVPFVDSPTARSPIARSGSSWRRAPAVTAPRSLACAGPTSSA